MMLGCAITFLFCCRSYSRVEVLSGFVNGLFLVVIAFSIMKEALTRILEPPHVHTDQLMGVSVAGLVVNLVR